MSDKNATTRHQLFDISIRVKEEYISKLTELKEVSQQLDDIVSEIEATGVFGDLFIKHAHLIGDLKRLEEEANVLRIKTDFIDEIIEGLTEYRFMGILI